MFDVILKWLGEHYPELFCGIVVAVLLVLGTVKIMRFYHRFTDVEKECDKISNLETDVKEGVASAKRIETTLNTSILPDMKKIGILEKNIHALVTFLSTKHTDLQSGLFVSKSPLSLSPLGEKILVDIGGKKYVDENLEYLLGIMEKETFKSGLDVQNYTTSLLIKEYDSDRFLPIKNYIFKNPIYRSEGLPDIAIDLNTANQVIAIYLRDKYFEKHPDLKDDDVA